MNEIKFRFWGPFGDWEEPDEMERKKTMLYGDEFAWEEYEPINDLFSGLEMAEVVAMQFTGLKDKNEKEIYEGDICKRTDGYPADDYQVQFNEGRWEIYSEHYAIDGIEYGNTDDLYPIARRLEVIGNIYENPDLLKVRS